MSTFRHVMLMTFKAGVEPGQVDAALAALATMPDKVPGIRRYEFGLDRELLDDNADLALVADFDSEEDWRAYATHPEHLAVSDAFIAPIKGTMIRVQYVVE